MKHRWLEHLFLVTLVVGFFASHALIAEKPVAAGKNSKPEYEGRISAKYQVEFESYDRKSNTYHIVRPEYPFTRRAWIYATPESIAKAITSIQLKAIQAKPESILGTIYSTDKDLIVVSPEEIKTDPRFSDILKKLKERR